MTHYLIEYRFQGKMKSEIKQMICHLDNKFHLNYINSKKPIPHISLAGPLSSNNEMRLKKDFLTLCQSTPLCSFKINGFGFFKDSRVVYIDIKPNLEMDNFRWNLSKKIMSYSKLQDFDYLRKFEYHATLAMKLSHEQFKSIRDYVKEQHPPKNKHFFIRATLIKNSKILCEYDFLQRKMLNRSEAKSKYHYSATMKLLNDFFEGKYDPNKDVVR